MITKSSTMEVTQRIEFECCYIFCGQLEAHRCKMEVTVTGPQRLQDHGVVITYDALRDYMKSVAPNREFLYCEEDYKGRHVGNAFLEVGCPTRGFDFPISAENLCNYLAQSLQDIFDTREPGIQILEMKLREDNNSFVTWKRN